MSKFHINKHGVPAPCKAVKGKCPLGGDSGDEGHFDSKEDAQAYADKKNEAEHSILPGVNSHEKHEEYVYHKEDLDNMKGKQIAVEYDGKSFAGEVIGTHHDKASSDNHGIIIKDNDGNVKHIKSHRLTNVDLEEGDSPIKEPLSDSEISEAGKNLTGLISQRKGSVEAPDLSKNETRSIDDLDTLVETRGEFITSQEHDPVENVKSMFDHVANKSGKLYRYNEENPHLETHNYNFERTIDNHKQNLEAQEYFDNEDEESFVMNNGQSSRDAFKEDVEKHRKLNDYSRDLAVEYGKDYESKVVLSGKYNLEEQEKLKGEYRSAVADKVGAHIQNYGEED